MKIELEILTSDLADRNVLIGMRKDIEKRIDMLSDYGKNTMLDQLNSLRSRIEWCENTWIKAQHERVINLLSQALNVDRSAFGDEEWHDA